MHRKVPVRFGPEVAGKGPAPRAPRRRPTGVPAPVHHLVPGTLPEPVRGPPRRHRKLCPRLRSTRPRPSHRHLAAVHHCRVLPLRPRGEPPRALPSRHVRRPRVDYESRAVALDRNELGARLVAAGLGPSSEHALTSLLALNGLRVSEATGADIEHLGLERGHRTLTITRRAARSSPSRWHPAPPARSTSRSPNERTGRCSWPSTGGGWTGTAPGASSARPPAAPGSPRPSRLTRSGTRSLPPRYQLDAGVPLRDVQEAACHADPRTTMRYDRARGSLDGHATYVVAAYVAGAAR